MKNCKSRELSIDETYIVSIPQNPSSLVLLYYRHIGFKINPFLYVNCVPLGPLGKSKKPFPM